MRVIYNGLTQKITDLERKSWIFEKKDRRGKFRWIRKKLEKEFKKIHKEEISKSSNDMKNGDGRLLVKKI